MNNPDPEPHGTRRALRDRSAPARYGFGVAITGLAFAIRFAMDDVAGEKFPFFGFTMAVIIVVQFAGIGPALLSLSMGFLLGAWFFVEPRYSLPLSDARHLTTSAAFLLIGLTIIVFGRSMHLARQRADAHAREALRHQKSLEQEVIERKRAEEEVRTLNAELEKRVQQRTSQLLSLNEELESFTYSVSHDLRAPLRHVDGFAQVLEEELGEQMSSEARHLTRKIRMGSQNMARLVDDLLNLSRVGKQQLNIRTIPLNPLVEEVVSELKSEVPKRRIEWRIGELPEVECDAGLIRLLWLNLLSNAVKYTRPRDEAVVEIGQSTTDGVTAFFVKDNGVGFDMKYVDKLFGVFQRLHRNEEFEGTGVGLVTVARIARKHGGRVWSEGQVGKGATFYFTLSGQSGDTTVIKNGKSA